MNQRFTVHLQCPYQSRNGKGHCTGETHATTRAKVCISVYCKKCGNVYEADLWTMKTYPSNKIAYNGRR